MTNKGGVEKNFAIDILKCLAALLITNSHFDPLYLGAWSKLATGGAIGDVLFFFCSGFTLFLGRNDDFSSWYKRRVKRIYPSVIMASLLLSALFGRCITWQDIVLVLWAWFIPCIMVYYFILYFVRKYTPDRIRFISIGVILLTIFLFCMDERRGLLFIYRPGFFKCVPFFLFMLAGAVVGKGDYYVFIQRMSLWMKALLLLLSITVFYGIMFLGAVDPFLSEFQLLTLIPLFFICLLSYSLFSERLISSYLQKSIWGYFIRFTSALTLEIYFMNELITTKFNSLFPLNIFIVLILIYGMAYLLKILSLFFTQTFQEGNYEWKSMLRFF